MQLSIIMKLSGQKDKLIFRRGVDIEYFPESDSDFFTTVDNMPNLKFIINKNGKVQKLIAQFGRTSIDGKKIK